MKKCFYIIIGCIIFFSCNNPKGLLEQAKKYEKQKNYDAAERIYLNLIIKHPTKPFTAEAMYNLANICKDIKKDYSQGEMWFSQVISKFPTSEYAKFAQVGILESPDYFGLLDGNIMILGDVETFGKNMKIKTVVKKLDYNLYLAEQELFAGEKFVRADKRYYLKTNNEIREFVVDPRTVTNKEAYTIVLKYPYKKEIFWTTNKDNKKVNYNIIETDLSIKIGDKKFDKCIKVMEKFDNSVGIKYLYYAPNIGCIKISTASSEKPDKEYISVQAIY